MLGFFGFWRGPAPLIVEMGKTVSLNLRRISGKVVREAAETVLAGGVILYPTDTIYGLGCDAFKQKAVDRIFRIKRRADTKPTLLLVRNREMLRELVEEIPPMARLLMKRFWPGPLTLVFRAHGKINPIITAGTQKIGIRIPDNSFCLKLIEACKRPLVSTSANMSRRPNIADRKSLIELFANKVDLFIDAGRLPDSLPSTVVDISAGEIVVIREGAIKKIDLLSVL